MTALDILGWVAASFGMASAFPQLYRLLRTRSSAGVSLSLFQLNAAATGAWALHGFMVGVPQMQYPNLVLMISSFAVCILVLRDRKSSLFPALLLPPVISAALFGVDLLAGLLDDDGAHDLALLGVGQISQLRTMHASRDLSGVSLPFLSVAFFVQGLWLVWGILYGETSITVCATLLGTLSLINLLYFLHRLRRGSAVNTAVVATGIAGVDAAS